MVSFFMTGPCALSEKKFKHSEQDSFFGPELLLRKRNSNEQSVVLHNRREPTA